MVKISAVGDVSLAINGKKIGFSTKNSLFRHFFGLSFPNKSELVDHNVSDKMDTLLLNVFEELIKKPGEK
jgi:hypothetical protein